MLLSTSDRTTQSLRHPGVVTDQIICCLLRMGGAANRSCSCACSSEFINSLPLFADSSWSFVFVAGVGGSMRTAQQCGLQRQGVDGGVRSQLRGPLPSAAGCLVCCALLHRYLSCNNYHCHPRLFTADGNRMVSKLYIQVGHDRGATKKQ